MTIRYCERCGVLMKVEVIKKPELCGDCLAGKKPRYRGPRDSAMIPRKKIDALKKMPPHKKRD